MKTQQNYEVGQTLTVRHYACGIACIEKNTPFTSADIIITKAIAPKEPLNKYSEFRYDYKSASRFTFAGRSGIYREYRAGITFTPHN